MLLHSGHGSLPLHRHLKVVGERLPPGQHLVGHDLSSQLVQLVLVKRGRTPVLLPQSLGIGTVQGDPSGARGHLRAGGRTVSRNGTRGVLGTAERRRVTLRVLVHRARRRTHSRVPAGPHSHPFHLAVARIVGYSLLVHGVHGLVHLMHVVLSVAPRPLRRQRVSCRGRSGAGSHHTVRGAGRGSRAGSQHGPRRGARPRRGSRARGSSHRRIRSRHLHSGRRELVSSGAAAAPMGMEVSDPSRRSAGAAARAGLGTTSF